MDDGHLWHCINWDKYLIYSKIACTVHFLLMNFFNYELTDVVVLFTSYNLVGEFAHKVASLKEHLGNQLLSVVESFRKKNTEMKKDRYIWWERELQNSFKETFQSTFCTDFCEYCYYHHHHHHHHHHHCRHCLSDLLIENWVVRLSSSKLFYPLQPMLPLPGFIVLSLSVWLPLFCQVVLFTIFQCP